MVDPDVVMAPVVSGTDVGELEPADPLFDVAVALLDDDWAVVTPLAVVWADDNPFAEVSDTDDSVAGFDVELS